MTNQLNDTTKQIKEKNKIKNIFSINDKDDNLKQSIILKLNGNKKENKEKISQKTSWTIKYKGNNHKNNKNNNTVDSNKNEKEDYLNNFNSRSKLKKLKTKNIKYYSDFNSTIKKKLNHRKKDEGETINNQYNTIIYSNTINNLPPTLNNSIDSIESKYLTQRSLNSDLIVNKYQPKKKFRIINNKTSNNFTNINKSIRNNNNSYMISNKHLSYYKPKYIHLNNYNSNTNFNDIHNEYHYILSSTNIGDKNAINDNIRKKELELNYYTNNNSKIKTNNLIKEKFNSLEKNKYNPLNFFKLRNVENTTNNSEINKNIQTKLNKGIYISRINNPKNPKIINQNINNENNINNIINHKMYLTYTKIPLNNNIINNNNTIITSKNTFNDNNKKNNYNKIEINNKNLNLEQINNKILMKKKYQTYASYN